MEFINGDFSVKILSVLDLDWKSNNVSVLPRPYNAISIRVKGNAEFSDGHGAFKMQDNDILFMPEGVGYHLKSGEERIIVVHFELQGKKQNCFEIFTPENAASFREMFLSILEIWSNKRSGYYLGAMSVFYRILQKIQRQAERSVKSPAYEKIKPAVRYMQEHFNDSELTIKLLCEISGMSDTYFRRLFSEVYHTTPNKYLTGLRISHAEDLLSGGYYTIERVAQECGFADEKYFSTVFKKKIGFSPSQYKLKQS